MSVFYQKNNKSNLLVELNNKKGDNMELEDVNWFEAFKDFEECLNNIAYLTICKEQEKEEIMMDNVIFDDDFDDYGIEQTNIVFEDEIEAEIGGAFSSASDYWNYILG